MVGDGTEAIHEYDDVWLNSSYYWLEYNRIFTNSIKKEWYPYCPRYSLFFAYIKGSIYSFAVLRDPNVLSN